MGELQVFCDNRDSHPKSLQPSPQAGLGLIKKTG
jgi:hypothetical protein